MSAQMTTTPAVATWRRPVARGTAAALAAAVGTFQLALALGAPWGVAAWGGSYAGSLPAGLRASSAVSVLVYSGLVVLVLRPRQSRGRRIALRLAAALVGLGMVANAVSPSTVEKVVWVPVSAALVIALWRTASDGTTEARG